MDKLKQAGGNWVDGDRFWGRARDIELMIRNVDDGVNMLLVAQRRMGKTSLMREVKRRLNNSHLCLFVDLQKAAGPEDAIVELGLALRPHKKLWNRVAGLFANILGTLGNQVEEVNLGEIGVKLRAGLAAENWASKGDSLFTFMAEAEKPVLLLLDEVPIMLNRVLMGDEFSITPERKGRADAFMSWLRQNSLKHQGKVRMILAGSVGLEPILHRAGLSSTINNFLPFDLKPWSEEEAIGCMRALAREYGVCFKDDAETELVKMLGWCIPHHVQMLFNHVRNRCVRRQRMTFSPGEASDIYENEMLGIRGQAELVHYEERLRLVLGDAVYPLALELLTEAAVVGRLTLDALALIAESYVRTGLANAAAATEETLRVLEHDGYLKRVDKGFAFESRLLKDWWAKRYGLAYVPASQRGI